MVNYIDVLFVNKTSDLHNSICKKIIQKPIFSTDIIQGKS